MLYFSLNQFPANSSLPRLFNTSPCLYPAHQAVPGAVGIGMPTWTSRGLPSSPSSSFRMGCNSRFATNSHVYLFLSFSLNIPGAYSCLASVAIFSFSFCVKIVKFLPQEKMRISLGAVLIWLLQWLRAAFELSEGPARLGRRYGKPGIERDLNPAHFRESKKTFSPEDVGPRSILENYTRVPGSQPAAYLPMAAVSICSPTPPLYWACLWVHSTLQRPLPPPPPCLTECW